jgi:hypothetical protein
MKKMQKTGLAFKKAYGESIIRKMHIEVVRAGLEEYPQCSARHHAPTLTLKRRKKWKFIPT